MWNTDSFPSGEKIISKRVFKKHKYLKIRLTLRRTFLWESNSRSAGQDVHRLLRNKNIYCRLYNRPPTLSQIFTYIIYLKYTWIYYLHQGIRFARVSLRKYIQFHLYDGISSLNFMGRLNTSMTQKSTIRHSKVDTSAAYSERRRPEPWPRVRILRISVLFVIFLRK